MNNSEVILNKTGAIYHLDLLPEQVANTVLLVGDQDRVDKISRRFDYLEYKVRHREFATHTGFYNGKRLTSLSTGIGTDNIDITLNELNLLFNYDFITNKWRKEKKAVRVIRVGTSGTVQKEIAVNSVVASTWGIGLDGLLSFYNCQYSEEQSQLMAAFDKQLSAIPDLPKSYAFPASQSLLNLYKDKADFSGLTLTCSGFYGPQGRIVNEHPKTQNLLELLSTFSFDKKRITNLEMESSGIYGLSSLFDFECISLNAILANRITGEFSSDPEKAVERVIDACLSVFV